VDLLRLETEPLPDDRFAVRMGLRYVKELGKERGEQIVAARGEGPFRSVKDFMQRINLDGDMITRFAQSGVLGSVAENRRGALWEVKGLTYSDTAPIDIDDTGPTPSLKSLTERELSAWDYETMNHTTWAHPLALMRTALQNRGLPDAETIHATKDGEWVRYAGVVICRQRPGTANGVMFTTLEDETGFVNVIIWRHVWEQYRVITKTASFLGVTDTVQSEKGIMHLVARKLWIPRVEKEPETAGSRDFR